MALLLSLQLHFYPFYVSNTFMLFSLLSTTTMIGFTPTNYRPGVTRSLKKKKEAFLLNKFV